MFTNLGASWAPYYWAFYGGFICKHDWSLTPFKILFLSQENVGWSWKFKASNHGFIFLVNSFHPGTMEEPAQNHLIGTKDIPITQEITRVSRALCQEPVAETSIYIFSVILQGHTSPCSHVQTRVPLIFWSCFYAPCFLSTSNTSLCLVICRPSCFPSCKLSSEIIFLLWLLFCKSAHYDVLFLWSIIYKHSSIISFGMFSCKRGPKNVVLDNCEGLNNL